MKVIKKEYLWRFTCKIKRKKRVKRRKRKSGSLFIYLCLQWENNSIQGCPGAALQHNPLFWKYILNCPFSSLSQTSNVPILLRKRQPHMHAPAPRPHTKFSDYSKALSPPQFLNPLSLVKVDSYTIPPFWNSFCFQSLLLLQKQY